MKFKSFGCSFIFGTDLPDSDDGSHNLFINPSQLTWPAILAQTWNFDYECYAYAGMGNLQILEKVLSQATCDPAVFVISWTWMDRFDYKDQSHKDWKTIRPTSNTDYSEFYYRNLHSQYTDKFRTLSCIKLAVDILQEHNHKFIMTYMDDLIFEKKWHSSPTIDLLQESVEPYMTTFEGQTFLQWAKKNQYKINERMHPDQDAHAAAAELIINQGLL